MNMATLVAAITITGELAGRSVRLRGQSVRMARANAAITSAAERLASATAVAAMRGLGAGTIKDFAIANACGSAGITVAATKVERVRTRPTDRSCHCANDSVLKLHCPTLGVHFREQGSDVEEDSVDVEAAQQFVERAFDRPDVEVIAMPDFDGTAARAAELRDTGEVLQTAADRISVLLAKTMAPAGRRRSRSKANRGTSWSLLRPRRVACRD